MWYNNTTVLLQKEKTQKNERRTIMAQNTRHRNYRVRYDRIIFTVIMLIVFVLILSSCISSCGKSIKENTESSRTTLDDALETGSGGNLSVPTPSTKPQASEYATISKASDDMHTGDLILSNAAHPCTFNEADINSGISPDVSLVTIRSILDTKSEWHYSAANWEVGLDRTAANAMDAWLEGFYSVTGNTDIRMIKGYDPDSDDPDFHTGRSLMLGVYPDSGSSNYYTAEGTYAWIAEHAAEYGFVQRYPEGKEDLFDETITSHTAAAFRYVGVAAAVYMRDNNLCLEEYLDEVKNYSIDNMLKVTSGAAEYGVYYIPASTSGSNTEFSVPNEEKTYTISGNNIDGFVITVALNDAAQSPSEPEFEDLDDEGMHFEDLEE